MKRVFGKELSQACHEKDSVGVLLFARYYLGLKEKEETQRLPRLHRAQACFDVEESASDRSKA
jgi:hypothetical protein